MHKYFFNNGIQVVLLLKIMFLRNDKFLEQVLALHYHLISLLKLKISPVFPQHLKKIYNYLVNVVIVKDSELNFSGQLLVIWFTKVTNGLGKLSLLFVPTF